MMTGHETPKNFTWGKKKQKKNQKKPQEKPHNTTNTKTPKTKQEKNNQN